MVTHIDGERERESEHLTIVRYSTSLAYRESNALTAELIDNRIHNSIHVFNNDVISVDE